MRARVLAVIVTLTFARTAFADRVAVVPSTGGPSPETDRALDLALKENLTDLGHTLVELKEPGEAQLAKRTREDAAQMGRDAGAEWVVFATQDPAVTTTRVELSASYVTLGRLELVAREVENPKTKVQVREMLVVLLKPEGIGTGGLPWETAPAKTTVVPPDSGSVTVVKPTDKPELAPEVPSAPYGDGRGVYIGAALGADGIVVQADNARGQPASMVGVVRGGYAILDTGLEPYAQIGGRLAGAQAFWAEIGARWMGIGIVSEKDGLGLHIGPSAHGGVFVKPGRSTETPLGTTLESDAEAAFTIAGSVDVALRVSPHIQLDAHLGEVRWVPLEAGSIVSVGGNLAFGARF